MPAEGRVAVVGVDLGTTTAKAVAYDLRGEALAAAEAELPLDSPLPGRAEQDAEVVLGAGLDVLAEAAGAVAAAGWRVAGVALSAAMHSLVGLDARDEPVTPLLTFADGRAHAEADQLRAGPRASALYARTGTPVHPMSPLLKLRWYARSDPATAARVRRWVGAKEHLLLRLFGTPYLDHPLASTTGLLDVRSLTWDAEALALAEVRQEQLGTLVPAAHVVVGLRPADATRLHLAPDTPFVVGASDGALANLGAGAVGEGTAVCTIGTSGAVRTVVPRPLLDPRGRTFCYVAGAGRWLVGGATSNGGLVLRWLRDAVLPEVADAARTAGRDPYEALVALAAQAPAGADGLLFLPHLTGERAPTWSTSARGVLVGLDRRHGREHIVRAALEGVVHQLRWVLRVVEELGGRELRLRATGGFAASPLWRQVLADVLGRPVLVPRRAEGSVFGAALLGMDALGLVESGEALAAAVAGGEVVHPVPEHARVHAAVQPVYERVHELLLPELAALGELRGAVPPGSTRPASGAGATGAAG